MTFPDRPQALGDPPSPPLSGASIETPWGEAQALRQRRLRPGPGIPREEVERNQRSRLFGAMVASVAERGYAATRLSELVELSGVSRKSFYALFADKEECFVAALEAMLGGALSATAWPPGSWEQQVRRGCAAFGELVVAQPAAARTCLIEAYVVGPAAVAPVEAATARFEAEVAAAAREAGMAGEALGPMISALAGALMEIARERLRVGRESELPELMGEFAELALAYGPPGRPLRLATRPPTPAPETLDAHGHSERVIRAFAAVVAERGYGEATIEMTLRRASMSPKTFYANFAGKEDVLFAAIESAGAQLQAAIMPPFRRNPSWAHGVRSAFGNFFNFLASRPALARLLMVETYAAGPAALERREEALRPLEVLLAGGRARTAGGALAMEVLRGSVYRLAFKQIRTAGPESLAQLAPLCTYMALAPLTGPEQAAAVANGDGRGRAPLGDEDERAQRSAVRLFLSGRKGTAAEIATATGLTIELVREQLGAQIEAGLVVALEEAAGDGEGTELVYHTNANSSFIDDDDWERMGLAKRQQISGEVLELIIDEIEEAVALGTLDARVDRHLTRMPLQLDERGWRELLDVHYHAFHASASIQAEAAKRLQSSGKPAIPGTSLQAMFEVPKAIE